MGARVGSPGAGLGPSTDSAAGQPTGNSNSRGPASAASRRITGQMFAAATERLDNGTAVARVMGEVDLATAPALEQTVLRAGEEGTGAVIVDLTGCTFFDSSGLRALVAAREHLERSNRRLALALSTPAVLRVFQITGLDELFEIHPSMGAASTAIGTPIASGTNSTDPAQPEGARG
jgi:anti-sigma B factor antagonist